MLYKVLVLCTLLLLDRSTLAQSKVLPSVESLDEPDPNDPDNNAEPPVEHGKQEADWAGTARKIEKDSHNQAFSGLGVANSMFAAFVANELKIKPEKLMERYRSIAKHCGEPVKKIVTFHKRLERQTYDAKSSIDSIVSMCLVTHRFGQRL